MEMVFETHTCKCIKAAAACQSFTIHDEPVFFSYNQINTVYQIDSLSK